MKIPVNEPLFSGKEKEYLNECINTGWISSEGKFVKEFEQRWSSYCGRKYGVAVTSGTAALQLAIESLDLKQDDEVILPTFTIISCALAVIYAGAKPVLIDCEPESWTMNVDQVIEKITPKTKAIIVVHIYGHPVDMDPILEVANKKGIYVIEDAAQTHCAEYYTNHETSEAVWKKCGGFGYISCFSFYANKLITTGEGGMLVTDNRETADKLRSLRNLCFDNNNRYSHKRLGFNYRFTNIQAAVGVAQIEKIKEIHKKKLWIGQTYINELKDVEGISLQVQQLWARSNYWMFGILIDNSINLSNVQVCEILGKHGIGTRTFFLGMHEQPVFKDMGMFKNEKYPVAETLSNKGLYLPSGLAITKQQISKVCSSVKQIFK